MTRPTISRTAIVVTALVIIVGTVIVFFVSGRNWLYTGGVLAFQVAVQAVGWAMRFRSRRSEATA